MRNTVKNLMLVLIATIMAAGLSALFPAQAYAQGAFELEGTGQRFDNVRDAVNAVPNGGTGTILLHWDVKHSWDNGINLTITNKTIIFKLNGNTLKLENTYPTQPAISANSANVYLQGKGELNVSAAGSALMARGGSKVTVTNVTAHREHNYSYGEREYRAIGVYASGQGTEVTVLGNVSATGGYSYGSMGNGVFVSSYAEVTVEGVITASTAPFAFKNEDERAGYNDALVTPTTKEGYNTYQRCVYGFPKICYDWDGTVWVNASDAYIVETNSFYSTLNQAISAVPNYNNNPVNKRTIQLRRNINSNEGINASYKNIILDLNGKKLEVLNPTTFNGLTVIAGQFKLLDPAEGEFNVTNYHNNGIGVMASAGGYAELNNVNPALFPVQVLGSGSAGSAIAVVYGDVTVTGSNGTGVTAFSGGQAIVEGEIKLPPGGARYIRLESGDKTIDDYVLDASKPGYRKYTDGLNTVWVKDIIVEIVETGEVYTSLNDAIAAVPSYNNTQRNARTIRLRRNIDHNAGIYVSNKKITFDLNGKILNVVNPNGGGLEVHNGGYVGILNPLNGEFNVSSESSGLYAIYVTDSYAGVTNVTALTSSPVVVYNGEVTVYGDLTRLIIINNNYSIATVAEGSQLVVEGAINAPAAWKIDFYYAQKGMNDYEPESSRPGYLEYIYDNNTVWVKNNVVEIVETREQYTSLTDAINAVPSYSNFPENKRTLRLLANINHKEQISYGSKYITLDLDGKILNVNSPNGGIYLLGDGQFRLLDPSDGEFNVTATNITGTGAGGSVGNHIEVTNVTAESTGVRIFGENSKVIVYGDVTVLSADASNAQGLNVLDGANVVVEGVIRVPDGVPYIIFYDSQNSRHTLRNIDDYVLDAAMPDYRKYTDGLGVVWVRNNVVEIVETGKQYASLTDALMYVYKNTPVYSDVNIKMMRDYTQTERLTPYGNSLYERHYIFDLNGHTLTIDGGSGLGLSVQGGSLKLADPENGQLNIIGQSGILVEGGIIEVTNVTATSADGFGARSAFAEPSKAVVHGKITSAGDYIRIHNTPAAKEDGVLDPAMPGYLRYGGHMTDDGYVYDLFVWVKNYVVEIVETGKLYTSLTDAINEVPYNYSESDIRTLRLLVNINHNERIYYGNKYIFLDLNGKILNVDSPNGGIFLYNRGLFRLLDPENGEFNVTGAISIYAGAGGSGDSHIEVTNVTAENIGVRIEDEYSRVIVYGNITVLSADGSSTAGVYVMDGANVLVEGVISVPAGVPYIKFYDSQNGVTLKTIYDYEMESSGWGYLEYTDGYGTVAVKGDPVVLEIVETGKAYASLTDALEYVYDNTPVYSDVNIKMMRDYTQTERLTQFGNVLYERYYTFDLNGNTLTIDGGSGLGLGMETGSVKLADPGNGQLNIIGQSGLLVGEASIEVTNVTATSAGGYGVRVFFAGSPSRAVVHGEITSAGDYIRIHNTPAAKEDGVFDPAMPGYLMYGSYDDELLVWVKTDTVPSVTLKDIIIDTLPKKLEYSVGEKLDITGMRVYAVYSNGMETELVYFDGIGRIPRFYYSTSPAPGTVLNNPGTFDVTVSHGGKDKTFKIRVTGSLGPRVRNVAELNAVIKGYSDADYDIDVYIEDGLRLTSGINIPMNKNGATLTIKSADAKNPVTLTRCTDNALFTVYGGARLILEDIIIDGDMRGCSRLTLPEFLVYADGGEFTMKDGAVLRNNGGGGVSVSYDGSFTMLGGEITGNSAYMGGGGVYVSYDGSFTMLGGEIAGNSAYMGGGGVSVSYGGSFTMLGGEITGNDAYMGGGVLSYGEFTMLGGEITGNDAEYGGVFIYSGEFTMFGGEISGNTADQHGVYVGSVDGFTLGGTAVIRGNAPNNLDIVGGRYIELGKGENAPAPGMEVWVTKTGDDGVIVASDANPGDEAYFFADESGKDVVYDYGQLRIDLPTTPIRYGDVNDDGKVDELDVVLMERHLARWPISINEAAADLNGDGVVDEMDIVVLERHLARWPGYEILPIKP